MPRNNRHDPATVWQADSLDIYGQPTWSAPQQIMVRWEEGNKRYITEHGHEFRGTNTIYFHGDGVIKQGDYISRGHLTDTSPPTGSWEVKQTRRITNLSGTKVEWRAIA